VQNINILYILQQAIVITLSSALMLYWYLKRRFHPTVFLYSLIAYALAIALKYALQIPTIDAVTSYFSVHGIGLGAYYGLQTVFFEVGLAFLVAWLALRQGALWENAILLGLLR
jgi:hypothetical protein